MSRLLLGDFAEGNECPTATPTAPLDPFGSEVTIQGERGVAEFTVEPGCEDIEVSLVNYETGRDGRRLGDTATGRFDAGSHRLTVDLRRGCENQVHLIVGKPDPDLYRIINEGRDFLGASDTTGDCAVGARGTHTPGPTGGGIRTSTGGTLPFTGAGLAPVLLLAGAALSLAGAATLYGTRAARRARGA